MALLLLILLRTVVLGHRGTTSPLPTHGYGTAFVPPLPTRLPWQSQPFVSASCISEMPGRLLRLLEFEISLLDPLPILLSFVPS